MKKYGILILWLIGLDVLTKYWAENILLWSLSIIPQILSLEYAQNIGIAFSIPLTWTPLKVITVILIFGIFLYYWKEEKKKDSKLINISYALIFAGAIGNAWERIFKSYVTDMISVEYFAIFNLADSYITLGAALIMYYYFKNKS
jgi:signal peptidase II